MTKNSEKNIPLSLISKAAIKSEDKEDFREKLSHKANAIILEKAGEEQAMEVFMDDRCDIDGDFMGFTHIYHNLAQIIPEHFTIIDFGCAWSPQAWLFDEHKEYIGVDLGSKTRFHAPNSKHFNMTIQDFIEQYAQELDLETTYVISSYVPDDQANQMVRETFKNVFTYYPSHLKYKK